MLSIAAGAGTGPEATEAVGSCRRTSLIAAKVSGGSAAPQLYDIRQMN